MSEKFTPPPCAWDLKAFSEASDAEIEAKKVSCSTCPVNMLCETGEGGTGYVCQTCGMTGVWIDEPDPKRPSTDVYMIDCARHKFHTREKNGQMRTCSTCTGEVMEAYVENVNSKLHYIYTEHARVSAEERRNTLRDSLAYWKAEADKRKAAQ